MTRPTVPTTCFGPSAWSRSRLAHHLPSSFASSYPLFSVTRPHVCCFSLDAIWTDIDCLPQCIECTTARQHPNVPQTFQTILIAALFVPHHRHVHVLTCLPHRACGKSSITASSRQVHTEMKLSGTAAMTVRRPQIWCAVVQGDACWSSEDSRAQVMQPNQTTAAWQASAAC